MTAGNLGRFHSPTYPQHLEHSKGLNNSLLNESVNFLRIAGSLRALKIFLNSLWVLEDRGCFIHLWIPRVVYITFTTTIIMVIGNNNKCALAASSVTLFWCHTVFNLPHEVAIILWSLLYRWGNRLREGERVTCPSGIDSTTWRWDPSSGSSTLELLLNHFAIKVSWREAT